MTLEMWIVPHLSFICSSFLLHQYSMKVAEMWQSHALTGGKGKKQEKRAPSFQCLCFMFTHREWQAKSNLHEKTQEKSHSLSLIGSVTWKGGEGDLDFKERNSFPRTCGDKHCCALVNKFKTHKKIEDRFPCIQFGSHTQKSVQLSVFLLTLHFSVKVYINPPHCEVCNRSLVRSDWTHFSIYWKISQQTWVN